MKWIVTRIVISATGIIIFAAVLKLELGDITTFILATLGLFLIFVGLTLKGLVKIFTNII